MKIDTAVELLAALAHGHRLRVFRRLVEAGEEGLSAGALAQHVGVPAATLSFHLKELAQAGLISARADRQFIFYRANFKLMTDLVGHLTDNCCGGRDCGVPQTGAKVRLTRARRAA